MRARSSICALLLVAAPVTAAAQGETALWAIGGAMDEGMIAAGVATLRARGHTVRPPEDVRGLATTLVGDTVAMPSVAQAEALGSALGVASVVVLHAERGSAPDTIVLRALVVPGGATAALQGPAADTRLGVARVLGSALQPAASAPAVASAVPGVVPPVAPRDVAPAPAGGLPRSFVRAQDLSPAPPSDGWNGGRANELPSFLVFAGVTAAAAIVAFVGLGALGNGDDGIGIPLTVIGGVLTLAFGAGLFVVIPMIDTPGASGAAGARYGALPSGGRLPLGGSF